MTAIIGLHFFGGVLMMADTEETLGGDAKSSCDKLFRFTFKYGDSVGTAIMGGAGDSHLIEYANQELHKFFAQKLQPQEDIIEALNVFAREFFRQSMLSYRGISYRLVPGFDMLFAVNIHGNLTRLFCWKGNRIVMCAIDEHTSIGSGVAQTHPMLRDVEGARRFDTMLFLGCRMMYHAKRAVVGVGGKTEALALHDDGSTEAVGTENTQRIEDLAISLDRFINSSVYGDISAVVEDVQDLEKNVQRNIATLPELIHMYRAAYSKILKSSDHQTSESQH